MRTNVSRGAVRLIAACLVALCAAGLYGCHQRNLAGTWNGSVSFNNPMTKQPMSIGLVFHVTKKDDGTYAATMDIPMAKLTALPAGTFKLDGDKVTFNVDTKLNGAASYAGTINADGTEIDGNMTQGGNTVALKLTKEPDAK